MLESFYKLFSHTTDYNELLDPISLVYDLKNIKPGDKIGLRPEQGRIVIQPAGDEKQVINLQGITRWINGDSREGLEKICLTLKCLLEWYPLHEYPYLATLYKSAIAGLQALQQTYRVNCEKVSQLINELKLAQTDPRYVVKQLSNIDQGDTFSIEESQNSGEIVIKLCKASLEQRKLLKKLKKLQETLKDKPEELSKVQEELKKVQEDQKKSQEVHWLRLGLKTNNLWQDSSSLVSYNAFQENLEIAADNLSHIYKKCLKDKMVTEEHIENLSNLNLHAKHLASLKNVLSEVKRKKSFPPIFQKTPIELLADKTKELWDKETIVRSLVTASMKFSEDAMNVYLNTMAAKFVEHRKKCAESKTKTEGKTSTTDVK